jgi:MraZ protein
MTLLIGRYEYTLDGKNRLAIPPKFRDALREEKGRSLFLTSGLDGCLYLFLPSRWRRLVDEDFASFSLPDKEEERAFKRKFFSEAEEMTPDAAGRILVPRYLKEHAGLRGPVLVLGAGRRAEVWDRARWNAYDRRKVAPAYEKAAKRLEI